MLLTKQKPNKLYAKIKEFPAIYHGHCRAIQFVSMENSIRSQNSQTHTLTMKKKNKAAAKLSEPNYYVFGFTFR